MLFINTLIIIVLIALSSINSKIHVLAFPRIASIILIYTGVLSFNSLYIQSIGSGIGVYSGLFQVTYISQSFDIFISIIGSLILVAWPLLNTNRYSQPDEGIKNGSRRLELTDIYTLVESGVMSIHNYPREYSLIILMSVLGQSLLISSSDLISLYLSIELQSFGVYILASLYKHSGSAITSGLKYFLLGGLSSCIILLGCAIIYAFTGLTHLESIYSLVSVSDSSTITQGLSLGVILIIIGILFKISAAPLHNWAPDVYNDSPTIVTIWLTIMPKISLLIFMLELQTEIGLLDNTLSSNIDWLNFINLEMVQTNGLQPAFKEILSNISLQGISETSNLITNLLLLSSLLSLIIGTVVGLSQSKIKRLLAYSTISHIGFILLALAINSEQSIESFIFYIIQYSITNLNSFLIIIALGLLINRYKPNIMSKRVVLEHAKGSENDIEFISELKGQFFVNPLLSLSLTICLFSMAGIPPLIGFFSKQFVLYSAVQSGYYFMSILAVVVSVISASYYLKIIKVMLTETVSDSVQHSSVSADATASDTDIDANSYTNNMFKILNMGREVGTYLNGYIDRFILIKVNSTPYFASLDLIPRIISPQRTIGHIHSFLISTLTLSILFFILKPSIILNSISILSLSLYNF